MWLLMGGRPVSRKPVFCRLSERMVPIGSTICHFAFAGSLGARRDVGQGTSSMGPSPQAVGLSTPCIFPAISLLQNEVKPHSGLLLPDTRPFVAITWSLAPDRKSTRLNSSHLG